MKKSVKMVHGNKIKKVSTFSGGGDRWGTITIVIVWGRGEGEVKLEKIVIDLTNCRN